MSGSTSDILGKLGGSVKKVDKAPQEQVDTLDEPELTHASSPKANPKLDLGEVITNSLRLPSTKKNTIVK